MLIIGVLGLLPFLDSLVMKLVSLHYFWWKIQVFSASGLTILAKSRSRWLDMNFRDLPKDTFSPWLLLCPLPWQCNHFYPQRVVLIESWRQPNPPSSNPFLISFPPWVYNLVGAVHSIFPEAIPDRQAVGIDSYSRKWAISIDRFPQ